MNYLNEQLHHKNTMLRNYEQQTLQLKSLLDRQKSHKFLKFPKQTSTLHTVTRLQSENHQLKQKLNECILVNTDMLSKFQKEKMFNRKLEGENDGLKRKVGELRRRVEAERGVRFVEEVVTGRVGRMGSEEGGRVGEEVGVIGQQLLTQPIHPFQSLPSSQLPPSSQQPSSPLPPFPQQPHPTSDLLTRTLALQHQTTLHQQQTTFLHSQLTQLQSSLQQKDLQIKSLKQRVFELEELGNSEFFVRENDRLAGEVAGLKVVREGLEREVERERRERERRQAQIRLLIQQLNDKIVFLTIENNSLKHSYRQQSTRRQSAQKHLLLQSNQHLSLNDSHLSITPPKKPRKDSHQTITSQQRNQAGRNYAGRNKERKNSLSGEKMRKESGLVEKERERESEEMARFLNPVVNQVKEEAEQRKGSNSSEKKKREDGQRRGTTRRKTSIHQLIREQQLQQQEDRRSMQHHSQSQSHQQPTLITITHDSNTLDIPHHFLQHYQRNKVTPSYEEFLSRKPDIKQTHVSFMLDDDKQGDGKGSNNRRQKGVIGQTRGGEERLGGGGGQSHLQQQQQKELLTITINNQQQPSPHPPQNSLLPRSNASNTERPIRQQEQQGQQQGQMGFWQGLKMRFL